MWACQSLQRSFGAILPLLMFLFSYPRPFPPPPFTCKTSDTQGKLGLLSVSHEPSSTQSLCTEPQPCSITFSSLLLLCRSPWCPQDSAAALHMCWPPGRLLGLLVSHTSLSLTWKQFWAGTLLNMLLFECCNLRCSINDLVNIVL